ncbi:hypothetical protein U5640_18125 [Streptomyces sp. SS7]|uniref:hypothetical protein n=1 Tax=Streptomyces sp. SS7 TaxID=3108485 RepID=UPI0030EC3AB4
MTSTSPPHRSPSRSRRRAARAAVVAGAATLLLALVPVPAQAHRDGCHRWHSCPSDTGSYVCGDLGHDTYCGGTGDSGTSPSASLDLTAPRRPKVVRPHAGRGGRVALTVTAERGSRIEVAETDEYGQPGDVVAKATATGGAQTVDFTAASGSHTYTVTATDAADNTSDPVDAFTLDVDAEAPAVSGFTVGAADAATASSAVAFTSEDGAAYRLTVVGREEAFTGTVGDGADTLLTLPDGDYTVRLAVTDEAGNVGRAERKLHVELAGLVPRVGAEHRRGSGDVRYTITAPPHADGTLTADDGVAHAFTADDGGLATVDLRLPDGHHAAPVVAVTDAYGRTGRATGEDLTVDTVAPALKVVSDGERASHGELALAVTTEAGAEVRVAYGSAAARKAFTSTGKPGSVTRALGPGSYTVTVVAEDAYGNTTSRRLTVAVDDRWTAGDWLALLLKAVLPLLLLAGAAHVHRRGRPARAARRAARAAAAHEGLLRDWTRERERLVELAEFAAELGEEEGSSGRWLAEWGRRRRDESVWWVTDADLVQPDSTGQAGAARDSGTLVITAQRVLFCGRNRREWLFSKLEQVQHLGEDTTLMRVDNRSNVSGVRYRRDPARTRLAIEAALADAPSGQAPELGTGRGALLRRVRAAVAAHDTHRPAVPDPRPETPAPAGAVP